MLKKSALMAVIATVFLSLSACGFKLRGSEYWPAEWSPVQVNASDSRSLLAEQLRLELRRSNVATVKQEADAKVVLDILDESYDQRPLTVGVDGRPREYELSFRVQFAGRDVDGVLLEPETKTLTRIYAYDPNAILAKEREAAELRNDLRDEMSLQILQRFSRLHASLPVTSSP